MEATEVSESAPESKRRWGEDGCFVLLLLLCLSSSLLLSSLCVDGAFNGMQYSLSVVSDLLVTMGVDI